MTVIAARRYRDGKAIGEVSLDGVAPEPLSPSEFVWIGMHEPTREEMQSVGACFGLHPLAIEDAQKSLQLPKVELYGDQLFLILRTAHLDGETITYGETSVFLGKGFLVTVRHGSARAHTELRARLESAPHLLAHGRTMCCTRVMDFIVNGYFPDRRGAGRAGAGDGGGSRGGFPRYAPRSSASSASGARSSGSSGFWA